VTTPRDQNSDLHSERHHAFHRKVHALRDTDTNTAGLAGSAPHSAATVSG
jgi:hypothetical protein